MDHRVIINFEASFVYVSFAYEPAHVEVFRIERDTQIMQLLSVNALFMMPHPGMRPVPRIL